VNYADYLWKATEKTGGNLYLLVGSDGHPRYIRERAALDAAAVLKGSAHSSLG